MKEAPVDCTASNVPCKTPKIMTDHPNHPESSHPPPKRLKKHSTLKTNKTSQCPFLPQPPHNQKIKIKKQHVPLHPYIHCYRSVFFTSFSQPSDRSGRVFHCFDLPNILGRQGVQRPQGLHQGRHGLSKAEPKTCRLFFFDGFFKRFSEVLNVFFQVFLGFKRFFSGFPRFWGRVFLAFPKVLLGFSRLIQALNLQSTRLG